MSNTLGAVLYRTELLGLAAIKFNFPNWGDEFNKNMRVLDALLGSVTGKLKGPWEIATAYVVGDKVVSVDTGIIYQCLSAHTSPNSGTLEQDLINNPARWVSTTSNASFRGNWLTGVIYNNNDFIIRNNAYYVARVQHTSGVFDTDLAAGRFILLIDINPFLTTINGSIAEAQAAAALAKQYRDQAGQVANFDPSKYALTTDFNAAKDRITALENKVVTSEALKAIELVAPTAGQVLTATATFTARLVGDSSDTQAFYSDYGLRQKSRTLNVYTTAQPNTVFKTTTVTGAGASITANLQTLGLAVNTSYLAELVLTDGLDNSVKTSKVQFSTPAAFKPNVGEAYPNEGGFFAFPNWGDGGLFDLVIASKSREASRQWNNGSANSNALSRTNGPSNTAVMPGVGTSGSAATFAGPYAKEQFNGLTDFYLGAIDELRAISSRLKPSAAQVAAFQSGGSEVFDSIQSWSSTETDASAAFAVNLTTGTQDSGGGKTTARIVRAIRRVTLAPPYAIGTAMEGGYLAAYFTDISSGSPITYMLIVADKATEVSKAWASASGNNTSALNARTNGLAITNALAGSGVIAMQYCYDLISGGKDDWYLGAIDEMLAIARMNSQLPSGQQLRVTDFYWSSTEIDASTSKRMNMSNVVESGDTKNSTLYVRPIRRVPLA